MPIRDRPPSTFRTGAVTRALRLVAAGLCALTVAATLLAWSSLPTTVPTHLDATGSPDAWGPRSTLLSLLAVWVLMQALLTWLSHRPRVFNYPVPVTGENAQGLYREGERMMVWVSLGVSVAFAGIVARIAGAEAGVVAIVLGAIALLVSTLAGLIRIALADSP